MPVNYVAEMMMDRIAASSVYKGERIYQQQSMEYYNREKDFYCDPSRNQGAFGASADRAQ